LATISISIPDAMMPRVTEAFKAQHNYQVKIPSGPEPGAPLVDNPETEAQFVKRMIREYVKELTIAHEATGAAENARISANEGIRAEFG
jgi:hypothetical protein